MGVPASEVRMPTCGEEMAADRSWELNDNSREDPSFH